MLVEFQHPQLGTVIGKKGTTANSYLGLPYATLEHRFADAKVSVYSSDSTLNATQNGPAAIGPPNACDMEFTFIQQALPRPEFSYSDIDCLNLNIFIPNTPQVNQLPVFVYVHGGGFSIGSNAFPQYNLKAFVEKSVELGTPAIAININYRLGVFGFLTSEELRGTGISTNNGLRDQIAALNWIKKYISGFGGDPDNITFAGESAGGVASLLHANSSNSLFKRAVSMGGTPLLLKPLASSVAEFSYSSVIDKLGLKESSPADRIQTLMSVSADEILSKVPPSIPLSPIIDGDLIKSVATFSQYADNSERPACEYLMIGDCAFDSSILFYMLHDRLPSLVTEFRNSIQKSFSNHPDVKSQLLEGYGIGIDNDEMNIQNVLNFGHDIGFYAPVREIARSWPGKAYVYHFNEVNPWDGRWKGLSTHILDVALLFLNYKDKLPREQQEVGDKFAEDMLKFVSGEEPWPVFSDGAGARVYGPGFSNTQYVTSKSSTDYGRRSIIADLAVKVGFDKLSEAWDRFMAGQ